MKHANQKTPNLGLKTIFIVLAFFTIMISCEKDQPSTSVVQFKDLREVSSININHSAGSVDGLLYNDYYVVPTSDSESNDFISICSIKDKDKQWNIPTNTRYREFSHSFLIGKYAVFTSDSWVLIIDLEEKLIKYASSRLTFVKDENASVIFKHLKIFQDKVYFVVNDFDSKLGQIIEVNLLNENKRIVAAYPLEQSVTYIGEVNVFIKNGTNKPYLTFTKFRGDTQDAHNVYVIDIDGNTIKNIPYTQPKILEAYYNSSQLNGTTLVDRLFNSVIGIELISGKVIWKTILEESTISRNYHITISDNFLYAYGSKMKKIALNSGKVVRIVDLNIFPPAIERVTKYPDRHVISAQNNFSFIIHMLGDDSATLINNNSKDAIYGMKYITPLDNYVGHEYDDGFLTLYEIRQ